MGLRTRERGGLSHPVHLAGFELQGCAHRHTAVVVTAATASS